MKNWTPVRSRHGVLTHATYDCRKSLCGKRVDGWIVGSDAIVTCRKCHEAVSFN